MPWDEFAILGAERVRDAQGPDELRAELERLFLPIAPTLDLWEEGTPPPDLPTKLTPADTTGLEVVAWQHLGMGVGLAGTAYQSARLNRQRELTFAARPGTLTRRVDAAALLDEEIRLVSAARALDPGARAQLWLRIDLESGETAFFDNMVERPVRSLQWQEVAIEAQVPSEAAGILLGTITEGGGAEYAPPRLEVRGEDGQWRSVDLEDPASEPREGTDPEGGDAPPGWSGPDQGWRVEWGSSVRVAPERFTFGAPLFDAAPKPGEVVEREVAGGLRARVPLALYSRSGRTLGEADPEASAWLEAELSRVRERWTGGDPKGEWEALRVADVAVIWNVFQHFYPYFDVVEADWDHTLTEGLRRALVPQSHGEFQRDLEWIVAQVEDGHGWVVGPRPPPPGRLPATFEQIEGRVVVVAAAESSGLERGDVVMRMNGSRAEGLLEREMERFSGSVQWRRHQALDNLGRGAPGDSVSLEFLRDGDPVEVTVVRRQGPPPADPRPNPITELEPGIFYVNLDVVSMEEFDARSEEIAGARGVVFDLRGYPNGNHGILSHLSRESLRSAFWRVPRVIRPDFAEPMEYSESRWDLAPRSPHIEGRVAFMTDGRAISYAESVMGIVEHYRLGDIVGAPTAGANGNVNPFSLPGGSRIIWTGMRVENHDRTLLHGRGIPPTHPVERTIAGVREGRDEVLEAALARVR